MDTPLKIVTFNVKCGWYGKTLDGIAELLKEVDADIVGLQEVDVSTQRSLRNSDVANHTEYIAKQAGYPYWYFAKTLDYQGGFYGHGLLSKHPLKSSTVIWPDAQYGEVRNVERHEIQVGDKTLWFHNCHLSGPVGPEQYKQIEENYMVDDHYAIFVGDLNTAADRMEAVLGERFELLPGKARIDHVIISKDTVEYQKNEEGDGRTVIQTDTSDHNLIYALLTLKGE